MSVENRRPARLLVKGGLAFASVAAVVALAACGTNGATSASPKPEAFDSEFDSDLVQAAMDAAVVAADGKTDLGGTVEFMWQTSGAENDLLISLLEPFEKATGVKVNVLSDPGMQTNLQTKVQAGDAPDVVVDTSSGALTTYKDKLIPLSSFMDEDALVASFGEEMMDSLSIDGDVYGIPGNRQGMEMWYRPSSYEGPTEDVTIDSFTEWAVDAKAAGTASPLCMTLSSGPFTANNASQMIDTIYTTMYGTDEIRALGAGENLYNSDEYKAALDKYLEWYEQDLIYGGSAYALSQPITNSTVGLTADPQQCQVVPWGPYAESFIVQQQPDWVGGEDYDAFVLSGLGDQADKDVYVETGGWVAYAFEQRPEVEAFLKYFASTEFQTLVASTGHWLMANRDVPTDTYPSTVMAALADDRNSSEIVTTPFGTQPANVRLPVFAALAAIIGDPSEANIDSQLSTVDANFQSWLEENAE